MQKLVFEYQDSSGSRVSILYDTEKNFYVNVFNSDATNHFREWMYRVSTRLNDYLKKGVDPDFISLGITRNKSTNTLSVTYEILTSDCDVDVYITKSNEVVFKNKPGRSNFVHVSDRMKRAIDIIREELAAKSSSRKLAPADVILVDSVENNTQDEGAM